MKKFIAIAALLAMTSAASAEGLATISGAHGKVLVNQGEGFVPFADGMALNEGDKVLVGKESMATVSYKDCSIALSEPTVHVVAPGAACNVTPVADVDYVAPAPFPYWLLIGGGVVIVGGGCLIAGCFDDDDNDPVSPAA